MEGRSDELLGEIIGISDRILYYITVSYFGQPTTTMGMADSSVSVVKVKWLQAMQ